MQKYLKLMNQLVSNFDHTEFLSILRYQNAKADKGAQSASANDQSKVND